MTAHEHMTKHLRKVAGGGIAWERRVFSKSKTLDPKELLDAAVDIAWECLMPDVLERPFLDIRKEGKRIVFRIQTFSLEQILAQATKPVLAQAA